MSLLGKILTFVNVLAAIALAAVFMMDFSKRQAWSYANYVHDVAVAGLPLEADDQDSQGNMLFPDMAEETKQQWFGSTGGVVSTQKEEIERVKKLLDAKINSAQGDPAAYARILLPLTTNNADREDLLAVMTYNATPEWAAQLKARLKAGFVKAVDDWQLKGAELAFPQAFADACREQIGPASRVYEQAFIKRLPAAPEKTFEAALQKSLNQQPPPRPVAEVFMQELRGDAAKPFDDAFNEVFTAAQQDVAAQLKTRYDQMFAEAIAGKRADGKALSADERRRVIAHLLINLAEVLDDKATATEAASDAAYNRVLAVVGLKNGVREINAQARALEADARVLAGETLRERSDFAAADRALIAQLQARADGLAEDKEQYRRAGDQLGEQNKIDGRRQADVDKAREELAAERGVTAKELKKLREMTQSLYDIRLKVREASSDNRQLEQKIRELEKAR
jgi:hypothetical protein